MADSPPRGRTVLVDAGASLLDRPTLDELLAGVVTTRRVAGLAGVSPGTVSHHFPHVDEDGRSTSLARAAAQRALARGGDEDAAAYENRLFDVLDRFEAGEREVAPHLVEAIRSALPSDLLPGDGSADGARVVARFLHAAAAPADDHARRELQRLSAAVRDIHVDAYRALVRALDREFLGETTAHDLASLTLALADGLTLQGRHDPEEDVAGRYVLGVLGLVESMTRPVDEAATADALESLLPLPTGAPLGDRERRRIRGATLRLYDERGWEQVTIDRVSRYAGVSRASLVDHFGNRHALAAIIWRRRLGDVEGAMAGARDAELAEQMEVCVTAIAEAAAHDRELTAALLNGVFAYTAAHGPPTPDDPFDPRVTVPLPRLVERLVRAHLGRYREPWCIEEAGPRDAAALVTNNVLLLTMTRPGLEPTEVAGRVLETIHRGMLRDEAEVRGADRDRPGR